VGWTAVGPEFRVPVGEEFYLLEVTQAGSGAHPASYPMTTGGASPAVNRPGREVYTHPQLVPGQENVEIYIHSPVRLSYAQGQLCLYLGLP
jgi:hypothetical protein